MFPGDAHETSSESSNDKTWFRAATRSAPQSSSMNKPSKNNFAVVCFPYCSTRLDCFIILPQAANVRHDMCMHDCYYSKSHLGCVDATVWRNKRMISFCFIIILFGECSVGMGHPIFGYEFSTPFPNYSATRVVARTFHPM